MCACVYIYIYMLSGKNGNPKGIKRERTAYTEIGHLCRDTCLNKTSHMNHLITWKIRILEGVKI